MPTAEYWQTFIRENLTLSGDYYIPPDRKKVIIITGTTYYDLEPSGDSTTLKLDIRDPQSLLSYYIDLFDLFNV